MCLCPNDGAPHQQSIHVLLWKALANCAKAAAVQHHIAGKMHRKIFLPQNRWISLYSIHPTFLIPSTLWYKSLIFSKVVMYRIPPLNSVMYSVLYPSIKLGQTDSFSCIFFQPLSHPAIFQFTLSLFIFFFGSSCFPASVSMVKDKYTLTVNHDNHMRWWAETVLFCPPLILGYC